MAMLAPDLGGARVLDLFAGSGAVGIEALSRGARSCDFVENNPAALHALRTNVAALRVRDRARIFKRDAIQFIQRLDEIAYDIVFGASGNTWKIYDTPRAWRLLGMQPQDNAETYRQRS